MKGIDIEAQNIFEERTMNVLEVIEEEIDCTIDTYNNGDRTYNAEAIFEAIRRLYHIYQSIQMNFWDKGISE